MMMLRRVGCTVIDDGSRKLSIELARSVPCLLYTSIGHIAGITVDGVKLEGDWLRNDGAVPVKSALYPEGEKHEFIVDHLSLIHI